jgi:hypothetical protein
VCLASYGQLSEHHRSAHGGVGIPNNWYQSHGLKGCLILLKNESCRNCVLTIPLCRGGRDEATVENRVEIGRRKWPHAPSRSGGVVDHAHRRAPRVTRVFFAQMGWPDPNTSWPDPCARPGLVWRHHDVSMPSACTVGMPCQRPVSWHVRIVGPTCHVISLELSRDKLSRAVL